MNISIDKIAREWSYRVDTGIPDKDNPLHIIELRKVLQENKLHESVITKFVDNLLNKKNKVNEIAMKAEQPKIDKIMSYLKSGKLFNSDVLDQMLSLVARDQVVYDDILNIVSSLGIPAKPSSDIVNKIFSYSEADVNKIVGYLKSRSVGFNSLKAATDLKSVFSKTGLNTDFLNWLNNFTYPATPSVGSGEIALALLMKGGTKAGGKGDVMIDGKEVEVKGSGGRIKGQKGYSLGTTASKIFSDKLKAFLSKMDEDVRPIDIKKVPTMGSASYQLGKKSLKNNIFNNTAPALLKAKVVTKSEIVKTYEEALQSVFHGMDISWIKSHIDSKGQVKNIIKFIDDWFRAALKYYFNIEGFESLIILNRSGKMAYLDSKVDPVGRVKLMATPSFTSGASTQGATFQIDVK